MAIDTLVVAAASAAIKEAAKKTTEKAFDLLCKKHGLTGVKAFKSKYIDYCDKVLHIKTLASQERAVFVDDIYVPISLLKAGHKISFDITEKTTLDEGRSLLIKGLAGQGKSTILRKLLANNLRHYERLPIFYELKNYRGGSIEAAISDFLIAMGISIDEESVGKLLDDSNVKVYLDAFDETPPEYRPELLNEIKKLANKYSCNLICTTRPDTEIDSLTEFNTYAVCPLTEEQIFGIIKATSVDDEKSKELCSALKRSHLHSGNESILKSPILVVLYCISYNLGEEIPSTLSQFYSNIFETVFHRHDNIKGKVNRTRHWNDNRRIYRELFNCLCFISQRSGSGSFSHEKLSEFIAVALQYVGEDKKLSDKVSREIVSITNLIIEDGFNEYRYVHKSIQEFFSAAFICSLEHGKKVEFYGKCKGDYRFHSIFRNTLFFLNELDYYDYAKYLLVPSISELLLLDGRKIEDSTSLSDFLIERFLTETFVRCEKSIISGKRGGNMGIELRLEKPKFSSAEKYPEAYSRLFNVSADLVELHNEDDKTAKLIIERGTPDKENGYVMSIQELISREAFSADEIHGLLLTSAFALFRKDYNAAVDKLKDREEFLSKGQFFDF
ncbi:MAG: hypothetical protein K0S46_2175 [Moraxellaceae bacterium]|nr:hypothetical protein [Moraxellaceae bacterium]